MRTVEYKVSYENMISRIPGLFAYLDSNALGEVSLHHAYDSNCGCYGKIVENIKLPVGTSLIVDEKVLLEEGKTYTFRTIITYYYQYRNLFTKYVYNSDETRSITPEEYRNLDVRKQRFYKRQINSDFIKFIERGIGKIEIPFDKYNELINNSNLYIHICKDSNVITKEDYNQLSEKEKKNYHLKRNENVPKFLYLANVISLYNELVKMGKQCMFYQNHQEKFGNNKHMCCLCERYMNMGGDDLRDYVGGLIDVYKEISDEYFSYADNEKSMTLDFDIDLVSSYDDMGIMNSYITEWLPYKTYYKGDRVFYNGDVWHYQTDNTGYFYEDVVGSIWRCKEDNNGYFYKDALKVVFSDRYFEKINNVFEKIDIQYENTEDGTILTNDEYQEQYDRLQNEEEKSEFKSKYKLYSPQKLVNITKNTFQFTGRTDSKLKDLRRFVTYMNDDNIGEKPQNGYDWLFYYRIGNICNISTLNDGLGNILKLDSETTASEKDGNDLMAYGDVITNILANKEENTITFEYILNAHLIGNHVSSQLDEDKNIIHYWTDFTQEENTGVKYTETYNYTEGSDLDQLIKGEFKLVIGYTEDGEPIYDETIFSFDEYVNGKYDDNLKSFKFEFITLNNELTYSKTIANQEVNIISTLTDFEIFKNNNDEFMEVHSMDEENFNDKGISMYRHDYFNGITYAPTKKIDVRIERGSTSCFQQHIAFSEIKTLNDMEQHSGKIFTMNIS